MEPLWNFVTNKSKQDKGQKTLEAILIGFNFWEQKSNEMVS